MAHRLCNPLVLIVLLSRVAPGQARADVAPPAPRFAIEWRSDASAGVAEARRLRKVALLFFGADWDMASVEMKRKTFTDPAVVTALRRHHVVAIYVDVTDIESAAATVAEEQYRVRDTPKLVLLDRSGRELGRRGGFIGVPEVQKLLNGVP
jgi:thioredoxin-related protein